MVEVLRDTSQDLPSGSSLERVEHCKASLVLRRDPKTTSEYAQKGTVVHRFLEDCLRLGNREEALVNVDPEWVELCEAIDIDKLPAASPGAYQEEMTFGWNPDTDEVASFKEDPRLEGSRLFNPELRREWLLFRADVVGLSKDGATVYVGDYKTGYRAVPNAARNLQVIGAAWIAARLYGAEAAVCEIIYVRDGETFHSRAELDAFALEAVEERLEALVQEIRDWRRVIKVEVDRVPPQVLGPWCRYCPSFTHCPAQLRLINALGNHPMLLTAEIERHLTDGLAAVAVEKLHAAELALKKVHEAVYGFADAHPITMADGQVLGPVKSSREQVNGEATYEVLEKLFGIDVAEAAVELDSSKTAIRAALGPLKEGRKRTIEGMFEEVMTELRKRSGVTTKTSNVVKLHNPKKL